MQLGSLLLPVRSELERVSRELLEDLRPEEADLAPLVELAASFRGKQLRPALVLLSAAACGGVREEHIQVAKVVEMLHTATLVHDDVLDGASLRRQQPTVNARFGTEIPVLLGDYIYARAFHLAVSLDDPECSRVLSETTRRICQGEITQILHRFDLSWDEARYFRVIIDKTATLYGASCRLGAHYAGTTREIVGSLERFGLELGTAFQIVDDCLDLEGDEAVVGKSLGTDLSRGKLTLPLLWLASHAECGGAFRRWLQSIRAEEAPREEFELLQGLRERFPLDAAIAYSMDAARDCLTRAKESVADLPGSAAKESIEALGDYVLARSN
jgi:octaprenyl-diphosphate synthase